MTDETKKPELLFDVPLRVVSDDAGYIVYNHSNRIVCYDAFYVDANRIARLPELYDALFDSVLRICSTCIGSNLLDTPLDDVGRCCRANCPVHKYTALLKKVRDGE